MGKLCRYLFVLIVIAQTCFCADLPQGVPLSHEEWAQCEKYIKTKGKSLFAKGQRIIPKNKDLPCELERDPSNGNIFIHLKDREGGFLGLGGHKSVTKSIWYSENPKVVARCEADYTAFEEGKVLTSLKGTRGIIQLVSFIKRSDKTADILVEYCNSGSVKAVSRGEFRVQENELYSVVYDLLKGLKNIHNLGYIHRDLQPHNIMLHRENTHLKGVINDLGSARKLEGTIPSLSPSVQGCSRAPEGLFKGVMAIDPRLSEAYFIGVCCYILIFNDKPSWINVFTPDTVRNLKQPEKQVLYDQIVELFITDRKICLREKLQDGMIRDLAKMTFKLLQPNPKYRINLDDALKEMEALAAKWNQALDH